MDVRELGVGVKANEVVLADGHVIGLNLIRDMHLMWLDSRSNRSTRGDSKAKKRTTRRRSMNGGSHLGAGDPRCRTAMDKDRSGRQSVRKVMGWSWALG